jgi:tRNA threonylcarbamoyladenosine biosynthesis protein TsaE
MRWDVPECCASGKHVAVWAMPDSMLCDVPDEAATAALAENFAARARPGDILLLSGPLGAGKTAFARAFIRARTGNAALEIPSPTFTLVQTYDAPGGAIWHYDLWRIDSPAALEELAWDEAQAGITLVEWPDRLGPLTPPNPLHVDIALAPQGRVVKISGPKRWFDAS